MPKLLRIVLLCATNICIFSPAASYSQYGSETYSFSPNPADGVTVSESCGYDRDEKKCLENRLWLNRDLGRGLNEVVSIYSDNTSQVSVAILFRYWEGKLDLLPDLFELHVFPEGKIYKPSTVNRTGYKPYKNSSAPNGEWLYLRFPVQLRNVDIAYLVTPDGAVSMWNDLQRIRPFRFEKRRGLVGELIEPKWPEAVTHGPPLEDRLLSCDPKVAIAAAEEMLHSPVYWKEPLMLFSPASVLFQHGMKDEGVFWFYAAQLRAKYQLVFEKGDRGQLLNIMLITVGAPINNYALQDTTKLIRILDSVLEWDKKTPNPFQDKARAESVDMQLREIYTGLHDFRTKLINQKTELETKAKQTASQFEVTKNNRSYPVCGNGK